MEELENKIDQLYDDGKQYTEEYKELHKELIELQCEQQWSQYENPVGNCDRW